MCHPKSDHKQARTERNKCWLKSIHLPIIFIYYLICMGVLPICLCITRVPGALGGQKRVINSLRLEFDCCGPPCGCWESNPGTPEEQPVLLMTEPPLQAHYPLPSCQRVLKRAAHLFVIVSGQNLRIKTNMAQQRSERNQLFSYHSLTSRRVRIYERAGKREPSIQRLSSFLSK